ncbi:MAG: hypothetical protein WC460_01825 [Patescibacteria group bacterium]
MDKNQGTKQQPPFWITGKGLLNDMHELKPEIKNFLGKHGITLKSSNPASQNVHKKDMVELDVPVNEIIGLETLLKASKVM